MTTIDDVRRLALALPDTEEHTHHRLPAFQTSGKTFLVVRPNQSRALLHVDKPEGVALVAEDPAIFEEERPGRPYGVWCDLTSLTPQRLERLIRSAWLTKAPMDAS
jgi:hypothetical protein